MPAGDAPRQVAPNAAPAAPVFDSRTWTGPETVPERPPYDVLAARAVFAEAGGPEATLPQRAASAVSWAGLACLGALVGCGLARRHRAALVRRFAAVEAGWPQALFYTRYRGFYGPLFVSSVTDAPGSAGLLNLLAARLVAGAIVGAVERRVVGLGLNRREPDDGDGTAVVLGMGALLLTALMALS